MPRLTIVGALSLCLSAGVLRAQERTLGKYQAAIVLGSNWTPRVLNKALGKDQFVYSKKAGLFSRPKNVYAMVVELERLLESKDDFERAIDANVTLGHDAPITLTKTRGYQRATRRFDAKRRGIELSWRIELASKDGLCYVFICWALKNQRDALDTAVDELLRGFRFPGPTSAWSRSLTPVTKRVAIPGYELSFDYRPFIMRPRQPDEGALLKFVDGSNDRALFGYLHEGDTSTDAVLDSAIKNFSREVRETSRTDFRVGAIRGRHAIGSDGKFTYDLLAVPLSNRRFVELRFVSTGDPNETRIDRDLLHRTLRLTTRAKLIDLPEPAPVSNYEPPSRAVRALLERCEKVAEWDAQGPSSSTRLRDGSLLIIDGRRAQRLTSESRLEVVFRSETWGVTSVVRSGDQWLAATHGGGVLTYRSGAATGDASFRAHAIARWRDGYLVGRTRFGSWYGTGVDVVVLRDSRGRENHIAEFPDMRIEGLRPTSDQRHVLVVTNRRPTLTHSSQAGYSTQLLDVDKHRYRELARWDAVTGVGVSSTGWLITGTPKGQPSGVYHLTTKGSLLPLLLMTDVLGLEWNDKELVFWSSEGIAAGTARNHCYRIKATDLTALGRIETLTTNQLDRIGHRLLDSKSAAPDDKKSIERVVAELQKSATELAKTELPVEPREVDRLFRVHGEVGAGGRIVLAMLAAKSLLDNGYTWVSSAQQPGWLQWLVPTKWVAGSAFGDARLPARILAAVLDDSEGSSQPVSGAIEKLEGRRGFAGLDSERLRSAIAAEAPANLAATLRAPTALGLQHLLSAHSGNLYLRGMVYDRLRTRRQHRLLEQVSRPFAQGKNPAPIDVRAWLAARAELTTGAAGAGQLATEVLAAVRRYPADSGLLLVLAELYEKARPKQPGYARTCYEHLLRVTPYGTAAQKARAALARMK